MPRSRVSQKIRHIFASGAVNRLTLASGAVPRDYMILAAGAIRQAQKRTKARVVGVEDVNRAATEQAKSKQRELQDDAAALKTGSKRIVDTLEVLEKYCLGDKGYSFFRIDFNADPRTWTSTRCCRAF